MNKGTGYLLYGGLGICGAIGMWVRFCATLYLFIFIDSNITKFQNIYRKITIKPTVWSRNSVLSKRTNYKSYKNARKSYKVSN